MGTLTKPLTFANSAKHSPNENLPLDPSRYAIRIERDADGFVATVPALPGVICVMDTEAESLVEIRILIRGALELMRADGHDLPSPDGNLEDVRRLLPIVNTSKLACAAGLNRNTLVTRLRRGTPFPPADAAKIRSAIAALTA